MLTLKLLMLMSTSIQDRQDPDLYVCAVIASLL